MTSKRFRRSKSSRRSERGAGPDFSEKGAAEQNGHPRGQGQAIGKAGDGRRFVRVGRLRPEPGPGPMGPEENPTQHQVFQVNPQAFFEQTEQN